MTPPAASSAAGAAAPLAPRRPFAPSRPRRVSGPVRAPAPARNPPRKAPARRAATESGGLLLGLLGMLETLSSHRLLDRLIRGRLWIGIVAFALIGIVTLQLGLLKLNSGIGRALEKESLLQRENAALSIEDSELAGGSRVESQAGRLGMRLTGVGALVFHDSHARSDVPHAAAALQEAPKPAETSSEATSTGSSSGEAEAGTPTPGTSGESGAASEPSGGVSSESSGEGTSEASPETSSSAAGGESSEAPAPAATATGESSGAGGGTAAPGG